jgi:hypothetical protein
MITFNVVKESHGWAVRVGLQMSAPFWSRDRAVREANSLAEAIRRHGQRTQVIVEADDPAEGSRRSGPSTLGRSERFAVLAEQNSGGLRGPNP